MNGRGRPPTTAQDCEDLHAMALAHGIPAGFKIPRPLWDELLARSHPGGLSIAQAERITRTGAINGLWERHPNVGRMPGSVVLKDRPVAA